MQPFAQDVPDSGVNFCQCLCLCIYVLPDWISKGTQVGVMHVLKFLSRMHLLYDSVSLWQKESHKNQAKYRFNNSFVYLTTLLAQLHFSLNKRGLFIRGFVSGNTSVTGR